MAENLLKTEPQIPSQTACGYPIKDPAEHLSFGAGSRPPKLCVSSVLDGFSADRCPETRSNGSGLTNNAEQAQTSTRHRFQCRFVTILWSGYNPKSLVRRRPGRPGVLVLGRPEKSPISGALAATATGCQMGRDPTHGTLPPSDTPHAREYFGVPPETVPRTGRAPGLRETPGCLY